MNTYDLIVVSHLRWDSVWQRPQQLLSRIAEHHRVLFIEEPIYVEGGPRVPIIQEVLPNVCTLTPQLSARECGEDPLWLWPCRDEIARQVREGMRTLRVRESVLWFYTPTPEFLADVIRPEMIVYDVMDELANFKFAPSGQREREERLLRKAAVVFTGGASLYDAKKHCNPNTHLFASGVDSKHYATACDPATTVPAWMESIPGPRATYIGVIDERLDYDLIARMAEAHPTVQFLMCGPIVKVDPDSLPRAANLHYPGRQEYADLPRILKGTDVCLMPFARNEATRFISPTKTLEYMAADRPIVSTPIQDVERFYSDIVFLAETPDAFVKQIEAALTEAPEDRARKQRREAKILAEQAWDAIAEDMETLMQTAWQRSLVGAMQHQARLVSRFPATITGPRRQIRISGAALSERKSKTDD